jgi:hypothetical protein
MPTNNNNFGVTDHFSTQTAPEASQRMDQFTLAWSWPAPV